jgi:mRNA-degrading endonuclease YafQ of YafQ-DinJ toxin-antitoxin module
MDSKKVLRGRNANLPRKSDFTKEFEKDWRGLQHTGINLADIKGLMTLLVANEGPLPPEWKDHPLKGPWSRPQASVAIHPFRIIECPFPAPRSAVRASSRLSSTGSTGLARCTSNPAASALSRSSAEP